MTTRRPALPRVFAAGTALCAALAMAACATGSSHREAGNEFPANYKADILAIAQSYVNNPHQIKDAGISEPVLKQVGRSDRYVVCVRFNAKDLDGKYTGTKPRVATFRRGKLDQFGEATPEQTAKPGEIFAQDPPDLCKDAVYQPFPELEKL